MFPQTDQSEIAVQFSDVGISIELTNSSTTDTFFVNYQSVEGSTTPSSIDAVISSLDTDGNGQVSADEFLAVYGNVGSALGSTSTTETTAADTTTSGGI